jgi:predicted dehydrogenase
MAPSRSFRVVIAGYGLAGSVFHAPFVAATDGLELTAVVTRDPERREQLAREHPGVAAVDRLEDALDAADLVVVAAPNRFHAPLARTALDAGRHVVVDKPLAVTAADARDLVDRARTAGRLLVPFHNRRWDGDFLTLRALADEGRLGTVMRLESRFERWRPAIKEGAWRERGDAGEGGGLLLDLGSHLADQAVQLLGPVAAVYAELASRRPGAEVEDDVFVALEHASGAHSHLWASVVAAHLGPRFRVLGDGAAYVVEGLDPQEGRLRAGMRPGDPALGEVAPEHDGRLVAGEESEPIRTLRGDYAAFWQGLVAALRGEGPPPVLAEEGAGVVALLEAARESARRGQVVRLG